MYQCGSLWPFPAATWPFLTYQWHFYWYKADSKIHSSLALLLLLIRNPTSSHASPLVSVCHFHRPTSKLTHLKLFFFSFHLLSPHHSAHVHLKLFKYQGSLCVSGKGACFWLIFKQRNWVCPADVPLSKALKHYTSSRKSSPLPVRGGQVKKLGKRLNTLVKTHLKSHVGHGRRRTHLQLPALLFVLLFLFFFYFLNNDIHRKTVLPTDLALDIPTTRNKPNIKVKTQVYVYFLFFLYECDIYC